MASERTDTACDPSSSGLSSQSPTAITKLARSQNHKKFCGP
jgi:hypothetical protein